MTDNTIKQMIEKASNALKNSYSPYSHFAVASCISTGTGEFFTGVNVENVAYSVTMCAETSAIASMVTAGFTRIDSIVILSSDDKLCTPCGACRQRIVEFSTPDTRIYLCDKKNVLHTCSINELLPMAFTFKP